MKKVINFEEFEKIKKKNPEVKLISSEKSFKIIPKQIISKKTNFYENSNFEKKEKILENFSEIEKKANFFENANFGKINYEKISKKKKFQIFKKSKII